MNKNIFFAVLGVAIIGGGIFFSLSKSSLPKEIARASEIVDLKDGDTYDLSAAYVSKEIGGVMQKMLAYNGSIPGPTLRVPQGAEITINFTNKTDLLALLHAHGVRMENAFDGSQLVQKEMNPGESFSYKLRFPDAGVFWYHPHVQEVYGQGLGLYGAFLVTPKDDAYFPKVNREVPLFLSDLPFADGKIGISKGDKTHSLMGHYGNLFLVNGEEDFSMEAQEGEVVRFALVNAANARPFAFAIPKARMKLVAGDASAYEKEEFVEQIILSPSERALVDVFFEKTGMYEIQNKAPQNTRALGKIIVNLPRPQVSYEKEFGALRTNSDVIKSIDPFRPFFAIEPEKKIALTLSMGQGMMQGMGHMHHGGAGHGASDGIEWEDPDPMMNQMSNTNMVTWKLVDQETGKENQDIYWTFTKGKPVKIRIFNDPNSMHPMQHPIHFHGQRFLVVERNGAKQKNLAWKDTALVRSGETVDIILDPSNPGEWMAHCHISEHLEANMMFHFKVEE